MTDELMKDEEEPTCVYDIVVGGRLVIYVGMTDNPERRMKEHRAKGFFPKKARMRVFKWFDTRREANAAEGYRQRELLPHTCKHFEVPHGCTPESHAERKRQEKLDEERDARHQKELEEFNRTHTVEEIEGIANAHRVKFNAMVVESHDKYSELGHSFDDIALGLCMRPNELRQRMEEHASQLNTKES